MSLVPAISSAKAVGDQKMVQNQCDLGLRFAFLIGFPCSIGMSLLSKPIICFFYSGALTADQINEAASLLSVSSLTVVLFTVVQATSAVLQGLQKQRIPMYTLAAGVLCKILLNYYLVAIPHLNIHGGPIASIVCYSVSMIPNLIFVVRYAKLRFNWLGWIVRPALAAACMGLVVWALRTFLPIHHIITILEILIGIGVYVASAFLFRAITKQDLVSFRRVRRKRS